MCCRKVQQLYWAAAAAAMSGGESVGCWRMYPPVERMGMNRCSVCTQQWPTSTDFNFKSAHSLEISMHSKVYVWFSVGRSCKVLQVVDGGWKDHGGLPIQKLILPSQVREEQEFSGIRSVRPDGFAHHLCIQTTHGDRLNSQEWTIIMSSSSSSSRHGQQVDDGQKQDKWSRIVLMSSFNLLDNKYGTRLRRKQFYDFCSCCCSFGKYI